MVFWVKQPKEVLKFSSFFSWSQPCSLIMIPKVLPRHCKKCIKTSKFWDIPTWQFQSFGAITKNFVLLTKKSDLWVVWTSATVDGTLHNINLCKMSLILKRNCGMDAITTISEPVTFTSLVNLRNQILTKISKWECHGMILHYKWEEILLSICWDISFSIGTLSKASINSVLEGSFKASKIKTKP